LMANLWVEQEFARYNGEAEIWVNPTFGATYEVAKIFHVGVEYWMRGKLGDEEEAAATPAEQSLSDFNDGIHHYLGPALSLQFGKLWWSTAAYLRMDHTKRTTQVGDEYGHVWFRSVIGLSL